MTAGDADPRCADEVKRLVEVGEAFKQPRVRSCKDGRARPDPDVTAVFQHLCRSGRVSGQTVARRRRMVDQYTAGERCDF